MKKMLAFLLAAALLTGSALAAGGFVDAPDAGRDLPLFHCLFRPESALNRAECLSLVRKLLGLGEDSAGEGLLLYTRIEDTPEPDPYDFTQPLPETEAVEPSAFDSAVFIGDSVSLALKTFAQAGSLGAAQFLVSGSLSANNALWPVSKDSVHPSFQGVKMRIEEAVPLTGAKNVYIMLGMNDISMGLDKGIQNLTTLVGLIKEKAPEVNIILQSVTPMASTSKVAGKKLNNTRIDSYNEMLQALCAENEWYFLNIAPQFKDKNGYLASPYCSDPQGQGIHFTRAAVNLWVDALKTHFPACLGA